MKNNKNTLSKFVDKLIGKKSSIKIKKPLVLFSIVGLIISLFLSISLPLFLKSNSKENIYYKFDNKYFESKDEVYQY
ncbi:hypothetical protein [Spiroplasma floricola]|uniref:Uncharacterized protein n=1 Tax=Spiroplasma floricola 23-6 TaxID=1336749 RepID=A0A2K8SE45_9MOLU|nr:hypothetical protein [Spiroplasma floricola]AUB31615.1 hypothetical protein SFLOR_v1c05630 [Spiroplasma floricola 23-6]